MMMAAVWILIVLFLWMFVLLIRLLFLRHSLKQQEDKQQTHAPAWDSEEMIAGLDNTEEIPGLAEEILREAETAREIREEQPTLGLHRQIALMWPQLSSCMQETDTGSGILLDWQRASKTGRDILAVCSEDSMRPLLNAVSRFDDNKALPLNRFHLLIARKDTDISEALLDGMVALHRKQIEPEQILIEGGMAAEMDGKKVICIYDGVSASITLRTADSSAAAIARSFAKTTIPASLKKQLLDIGIPSKGKMSIRMGRGDDLAQRIPVLRPWLDPWIDISRSGSDTLIRITCSTDALLEKTLEAFNAQCAGASIRLETVSQNHASFSHHAHTAARQVKEALMKHMKPDAVLCLPADTPMIRMKDWCAFTPSVGEDTSPSQRVAFWQDIL